MSNSISSKNVVTASHNQKAQAAVQRTQKFPNKGIKIQRDRMDQQKAKSPRGK
jgi:hypothetical protein